MIETLAAAVLLPTAHALVRRGRTHAENYLTVLAERRRLDQARADLHRQIIEASKVLREYQ